LSHTSAATPPVGGTPRTSSRGQFNFNYRSAERLKPPSDGHWSLKHKRDQAFANDREIQLRVRQNGERDRERIRAGKTYVPPTADPLADRDIFLEIQESLRLKHVLSISGSRGPLVRHRTYPIHFPQLLSIKKQDKAQRKNKNFHKSLWVPLWRNTGDMLKVLAWSTVLHEEGGAAFTLHLTPPMIAAAKSNPRGFAYHLQQRIKGELEKSMKALGLAVPDFFFVVEATIQIQPHLHGAIIVPDHPKAWEAIKTALRNAGGFSGMKRNGREVKLKLMYYAAGYAEYAVKWKLQSVEQVGPSIFAATNGIRTRGMDWYERARRDGHILKLNPKSWIDGVVTTPAVARDMLPVSVVTPTSSGSPLKERLEAYRREAAQRVWGDSGGGSMLH
jgi:hypothetical protein